MAIDSSSFNSGAVFPKDVVRSILTAGLQGAPVFSSLTQRTTDRGQVVFPTSDPSGFDWTAELGEIPTVTPGDDALIVSVAKIAGRILLSNESIADADLPIATEIGRVIAGSMAAKADADLVYGDVGNPAAPTGFFDSLPTADGDDLRAAVVTAAGEIMGAGGSPNVVVLSPAGWAAEMQRREATYVGAAPLFADLGLTDLQVVVAATLADGDALVLDKAGCFAVLRSDYSIEASRETTEAWSRNGVSLRVQARVAAAIPTPAVHARAITVLSSS
jgi:hypothetical protein